MKNKVVLKKDFRGLKEGTELEFQGVPGVWGSWVYKSTDEIISENSVEYNRIDISFSDSYVHSKPEIFDITEVKSVEELKKERRIETLKNQVNNLLEEINKLEK